METQQDPREVHIPERKDERKRDMRRHASFTSEKGSFRPRFERTRMPGSFRRIVLFVVENAAHSGDHRGGIFLLARFEKA